MKVKSCISKEKIEVIVKENRKSKYRYLQKGKEYLREKIFESLQSASIYAVSEGNKK